MKNPSELVPSVQELYTPKAITKLNGDRSLCERVQALKMQEKDLQDLLKEKDLADIHSACRERVLQMLTEADAEKTADSDSDPAAFTQSVYDLPRSPFTARMRRRARETARVYKHVCTGSLFVPHDLDGFQRLWELAMEGEPRWNENYPSSDFRTHEVKIYDSLLGQKVLQVCSAPDRIRPELIMLLALMPPDQLLPEIRAICGFSMFEWIHPFGDGNGHTGRMFMLAVLSEYYSLPSVVCFSSEFVIRKGRTAKAFATLRTREGTISKDGDLSDFCSAVLSQLEDAQTEAMRLVQKARSCCFDYTSGSIRTAGGPA